ncbi:MAG: hypothetical protein IJI14_19795, partial [Anaerolineaceae bacterium]|nr:hypothetical protein [Anaerolineaceae bacterium]
MKIRIINEKDWEKSYDFDKSIIRVGSQYNCDIQIRETGVAPLLMQIVRNGTAEVSYIMRFFDEGILITRGDQTFPSEQTVPYEVLDGDKITFGVYRMIITLENDLSRVRQTEHMRAEMFLSKSDLSPDNAISGGLLLKNLGTEKPCQFKMQINGIPEECLTSAPLPYLHPGISSSVGFVISHLRSKPAPGFHTVSIILTAPDDYFGEKLEFNQNIYVQPVFDSDFILEDDSQRLSELNPKQSEDTADAKSQSAPAVIRDIGFMNMDETVLSSNTKQDASVRVMGGNSDPLQGKFEEPDDEEEELPGYKKKREKVVVIRSDEDSHFEGEAGADTSAKRADESESATQMRPSGTLNMNKRRKKSDELQEINEAVSDTARQKTAPEPEQKKNSMIDFSTVVVHKNTENPFGDESSEESEPGESDTPEKTMPEDSNLEESPAENTTADETAEPETKDVMYFRTDSDETQQNHEDSDALSDENVRTDEELFRIAGTDAVLNDRDPEQEEVSRDETAAEDNLSEDNSTSAAADEDKPSSESTLTDQPFGTENDVKVIGNEGSEEKTASENTDTMIEEEAEAGKSENAADSYTEPQDVAPKPDYVKSFNAVVVHNNSENPFGDEPEEGGTPDESVTDDLIDEDRPVVYSPVNRTFDSEPEDNVRVWNDFDEKQSDNSDSDAVSDDDVWSGAGHGDNDQEAIFRINGIDTIESANDLQSEETVPGEADAVTEENAETDKDEAEEVNMEASEETVPGKADAVTEENAETDAGEAEEANTETSEETVPEEAEAVTEENAETDAGQAEEENTEASEETVPEEAESVTEENAETGAGQAEEANTEASGETVSEEAESVTEENAETDTGEA